MAGFNLGTQSESWILQNTAMALPSIGLKPWGTLSPDTACPSARAGGTLFKQLGKNVPLCALWRPSFQPGTISAIQGSEAGGWLQPPIQHNKQNKNQRPDNLSLLRSHTMLMLRPMTIAVLRALPPDSSWNPIPTLHTHSHTQASALS